jgi:hypothetical protein
VRADETYDTLGRVTVGSTIKSNLVKSTQSCELDTPSSNSDVVGNDWVVAFGVGFGEIIDKRSVEVECSREDLLVVPQNVTGQGSHVSNSLGSGKTVHGDLGLGGTELEGCRASRRSEVDNLDKVEVESATGRVLDSSTDKVLVISMG